VVWEEWDDDITVLVGAGGLRRAEAPFANVRTQRAARSLTHLGPGVPRP